MNHVASHNLNILAQLEPGIELSVDAKGYLIERKSSEKPYISTFFSNETDALFEAINQTCQKLFNQIIANHPSPLASDVPALAKERIKVKQILDGVGRLGKNILSSKLEADLNELVESPETLEARLAIRQGIVPKVLNQTISGTYVMHNRLGQPWGIFKPKRQEVGGDKNPSWVVWGTMSAENWDIESCTGYVRECVAYQLDKEHFSEVPLTLPTNFKHPILDTSILPFFTPNLVGSFQLFKKDCDALADRLNLYECVKGKQKNGLIDRIYLFIMRTLFYFGLAHIPTEQIHKMAILDIRILNCDRHLGNCLIEKNSKTIYPIDHGLILPNKVSRLRFDWKNLIQSHFPFSSRSLTYIKKLDPNEDANILKNAGISKEAIDRMKLSTMLLKIAASRQLSPYQIAELMQGNNNTYFENSICRRILLKGENPELVLNQAIDAYTKNYG